MSPSQLQESVDISAVWKAYRSAKSESLKKQLVTAHHHLVRIAVSSLRKRSGVETAISDDDLMQLGYMGLLDAIEKFDPNLNVRFDTYAMTRIRGAIQDGLRQIDWVPRQERKRVRETEQMLQKIEQYRTESLSVDELAEKLSIQPEELAEITMQSGGNTMISADFSNQDSDIVATVQAPDDENPLEQTTMQELKVKLFELLQELPERERLIVTLYYYEGLTFKEIGKILQISESRVFQIHRSVLDQFREQLAEYQ